MSIFPKRAAPGETVTIHWNFNTAHLTDVHNCPWVRIGVQAPDGTITMLFEDHVLGLPDPPQEEEQELAGKQLKYLNKSLPLLIISDYLSGQLKRERLIEILQNIQSGRHYYFTYQLPENAPLGKYTLISEVHSGGEIRKSKTAADDFFLVEKVTLRELVESNGSSHAVVINHSPEKTPVKIVNCQPLTTGKMKTRVDVFEMDGGEEKSVSLATPLVFLLYNEERKVVPLTKHAPDFLLRNQQILEMNRADGKTYLMKKDSEEGYALSQPAKDLWNKANGLLNLDGLSKQELEAYKALKSENLISTIRF